MPNRFEAALALNWNVLEFGPPEGRIFKKTLPASGHRRPEPIEISWHEVSAFPLGEPSDLQAWVARLYWGVTASGQSRFGAHTRLEDGSIVWNPELLLTQAEMERFAFDPLAAPNVVSREVMCALVAMGYARRRDQIGGFYGPTDLTPWAGKSLEDLFRDELGGGSAGQG